MTPRIALFFGALIVGILIVDVILVGSEHIVFLGKKLVDLVEWIAFWR